MKTLKKRRHRKYNGQRGGGIFEWLFGKKKNEEELEPRQDPKLEPESGEDPKPEPDMEPREEAVKGGGGRRRRYLRRRSSRRKKRVSKKY